MATPTSEDRSRTPWFLRGSIFAQPPVLRMLFAYAIVLLTGGHGVLPAGLVLVMGLSRGGPEPLQLVMATGWLGVAALAATLLPWSASHRRWLTLWGAVLLLASVLIMTSLSEDPAITLASALPFAAFSAWHLVRLWRPSAPSTAR